jgi:hypothetical protein
VLPGRRKHLRADLGTTGFHLAPAAVLGRGVASADVLRRCGDAAVKVRACDSGGEIGFANDNGSGPHFLCADW